MSSPPPPNPLKRSMTSISSSQLGAGSSGNNANPKRARMHPLRQTSFPSTMDDPRHSTFSAASDAGSVTGSLTGSLDGQQSQPQGQQPKGGKKRGRKSKAEKEREREREDALSRSGLGGGSAGGGFRGSEARVGSVDVDGGSSVRTGPAGGGPGGGPGGGGAGGNADDAEDEEDFDDEGELLGREEGATDIEAEKKNLAYVSA